MVEAGITKPTELLQNDHIKVLERLDWLDKAVQELAKGRGPAFGPAKVTVQQVAEFLQKDVELHLRKEEEALFPPLEEVIGSEGGPTAVMRLEHQELRTNNQELQRLAKELEKDRGATEIIGQIQRVAPYICDFLRQHIHKENFILFPLAEEELDEATLQQIAERMRAIEEGWLGG